MPLVLLKFASVNNYAKFTDMRRNIVIVLLAVSVLMASAAAYAQTHNRAVSNKIVSNKTVYIVDGKIVTQQYMNALPVDKIANMDVITNIEKVIVVKTNNPSGTTSNFVGGEVEFKPIKQVKTSDGDVLKIVADDDARVINVSKSFNGTINEAQPLYLFRSSEGKITPCNNQKITAEQIQFMVVLHGRQTDAYKKYGDVSKGVVLITPKPKKKQKKQ